MRKDWMSVTAGTLEVVVGTVGLVIGFQVDVFKNILQGMFGLFSATLPAIPDSFLTTIVVVFSLFGLLAIVGGTFAGQRRVWGLAFAGSLVTFFICWPLGLATIIFVCLARSQFA